jgi:hypothetical protein
MLKKKYGAKFVAELQPEDVALMMVALKLSRECNKHKEDNLLDIAGYIGTIEKIIKERNKRELMTETFCNVREL